MALLRVVPAGLAESACAHVLPQLAGGEWAGGRGAWAGGGCD